jgi:hypothetical protein
MGCAVVSRYVVWDRITYRTRRFLAMTRFSDDMGRVYRADFTTLAFSPHVTVYCCRTAYLEL